MLGNIFVYLRNDIGMYINKVENFVWITEDPVDASSVAGIRLWNINWFVVLLLFGVCGANSDCAAFSSVAIAFPLPSTIGSGHVASTTGEGFEGFSCVTLGFGASVGLLDFSLTGFGVICLAVAEYQTDSEKIGSFASFEDLRKSYSFQ
ncbi:hypothetical protein Tco_0955099 [Tanacetum coccineum]|uniref:Uncharacterized protein n=1 Tax=Tanacetum coccineum TaxID=301880 RepID=A0ABQ5E685_9ASTR